MQFGLADALDLDTSVDLPHCKFVTDQAFYPSTREIRGMTKHNSENQFSAPVGLAIALIAGAQLMIVLDATIVNVALPSIQRALHFSTTGLSWVLNAYTLSFGGLLLLGGRSGDLLGRRRMFQVGILIFAAASLIGGFATNEAWLLTMRAIQGVGGAIASPTALSLITTNFAEGKQRNEALGVYSGVSAAGAALGLLLGGILTQYASWRWVFFVNAPIALIIAIAAPRILNESEKEKIDLDLSGSILSIVGVGLLVYGLIHASQSGWSTSITIGSFVIAGVSLIAFVIREMTARQPLMKLAIFSDRTRTSTYVVMLLLSAALFAIFFFLTIYVQEIHGYSPLKAGFAFLPVSFGIMAFAGLGSVLLQRIGALPLIVSGLTAVAIALAWLSRLGVNSSYATSILPPMLIMAAGLGFAFISLFPTALAKIPSEMAGLGSAMVNVMQQVGGSLGLSILVTVSATATTSKLKSLVASSGQTAKSPAVQQKLGALAAVHGWDVGFLVGAGFAVAGLVIALLAIRPPKASELAAEGNAVPVI